MANKQVKHTYTGMNQDFTKSKFPPNLYFEGRNIRIVSTDSQTTGSVVNEKGNTFILTIPTPIIDNNLKKIKYGVKELLYTTSEIAEQYSISNIYKTSGIQTIIGQTPIRDGVILISSDELGFDCIWKLSTDNYDLKLLYMRNLGFTKNNPIQLLNNFENKNVDKIYWVDGLNQLRFLNIEQSLNNQDLEELIDIPLNVIDMVGKSRLLQPVIKGISAGGIHTAGMIQYGYNLYRVNSSQTKISSLSNLVALDKNSLGGGAVNELVGASPTIVISEIDRSYTNIKIYSIKYNSYNEIPIISLIDDREIPSLGNIEVFDDGRIIQTITLEEFLFLGSDIVIPKHINTKFNRLFLANYKEINFDVDLDTRAYSYNNNGTSIVYKDLYSNKVIITLPTIPITTKTIEYPTGTPFYITTKEDYDSLDLIKHDAVNLNYDTFKFQKNAITVGGEGKYLKYELTKSTIFNPDNKYFKDDEIYRIGIEFFNEYGQVSLPNWIADFKSLDGNLNGQYNTLSVTLKPEFFTWLNTTSFSTKYDKPIGYKIIIAERTINDRTIVANGLLSSMMIDNKTTDENDGDVVPNLTKINNLPKMPNILVRNCNALTEYGNTQPLHKCRHLGEMNNGRDTSNTEIMRADSGNDDTFGRLWQFNAMVQMYSPEIMFNNSIPLSDNLRLKIKGSLKNTMNNSWLKRLSTTDQGIVREGKGFGGISPIYSTTREDITGFVNQILDRGIISHPGGSEADRVIHSMFSREYGNIDSLITKTFPYKKSSTNNIFDIYGKPELTEKGQSGTNYNNDPNYRYINSLEGFRSDGDSGWDDGGKYLRKIISINAYGNKCITIVPGSDDSSVIHSLRPTMESMFNTSGLSGDNNGLIGELVKTDQEIYLGNIYGGNSYEDKQRSNYIEIGDFNILNELTPTINIESPGDTYVNSFKFIRIVRTDKDIIAEGVYGLEELVEFITESTIDLKNRNDLSLQPWDSRFQPYDAEYHKYNKVYSQLPTLIKRRNLNYNTKRFNHFDTNIIATKVKSSGEIIDSWTDLQVNETITLDGKYGAINSLTTFNDEIYAFQDKALSFISINPRVQVQGEDGLAIQLGSGSVLDRYKYISTNSGTINKWSICSSSNSLYYYDTLNSSLMMFKGGLETLSDTKGLHSYFINNTSLESLKIDNPLIKKGIISSFDHNTNDMFMTFHQTNSNIDNSYTLSFNEQSQSFVSFYDYIPSVYISKGNLFLSTNPDNTKIYEQGTGLYNNFYGINYPSFITLLVNPEADMDTVFDNIMYKSEVYLNDIDQPDKTLSNVQVFNEYQDSGLIPLIVGRNSNLRRKFRDWNAILPRNVGTRERVRNPWVYLKLQFDNTTNLKLVLHDIVISYTI